MQLTSKNKNRWLLTQEIEREEMDSDFLDDSTANERRVYNR